MSTPNPVPCRRTYTTEFRQEVVAQCQAGVSVSSIALAHGINANLLRKWIQRYRNPLPARVLAEPSKLVAVQVELPTEAACSQAIEISLTKRTTHINIRWPSNQAQACARWLGDWLK